MEVHFTHPRLSKTFDADIQPQITARQVLQELLSPSSGPFLPPLSQGEDDQLVLNRTNTIIPPNTSLGSAGVQHGDILDIRRGGQGASTPF